MIDPYSDRKLHPRLVFSIVTIICVITTLLLFALFQEDVHKNEMYDLVRAQINLTGVTNPVTAILLGFRAYDTLLEFAVLFCVGIACLPYLKGGNANLSHEKLKPTQLFALVKTLVPLVILLAGYLLWVGSFKPGGAFQAGALLASAGLLLSLLNIGLTQMHGFLWRLIFSMGLIFMLLAVCYGYLKTHTFLLFPSDVSGSLILFIEFAATFSIAATLYLCYLSVRGHKNQKGNDES